MIQTLDHAHERYLLDPCGSHLLEGAEPRNNSEVMDLGNVEVRARSAPLEVETETRELMLDPSPAELEVANPDAPFLGLEAEREERLELTTSGET